MATASREIVVLNSKGLHARPAMMFVDLANQFSSEIVVKKLGDDPYDVDGKSVMGMISLEGTQGTQLLLEATGDDAEDAVGKLVELFESKFGEE